MRFFSFSVWVLAFTLAACDNFKDRSMPDLSDVKAKLAFTCAYEKDRIPPRDPEADQLYVHARWLRKNNLLADDPLAYPAIERLIRIAAAWGHDKANIELRNMLGRGTAASEDIVKERLDLTQHLIDRGIPSGYFDMGVYLERGYGVRQDKDLALKYFRKAADLGSPEAQYVVAEKLAPIDIAPDIARQMRRCAAEQGHGKAVLSLAIGYKSLERKYTEALQAFQLGAKAGSESAASFLERGFDGPAAGNMYYLDQQKDPERVRRYAAIWDLLSRYSYLHPKVPEIDAIVPLPPAALPPWDGSFQWLKAHEANVPPPLPAEARIRDRAAARRLDPETGRPLKQPLAEAAPAQPVAPPLPLGTTAPSRECCPQSGMWECAATPATPAFGPKCRYLAVGRPFPVVVVRGPERTLWQKIMRHPPYMLADTTWTLVSYDVPTLEEDDENA